MLWLAVLFGLFYVAAPDMIQLFNEAQTKLTLALIAPFLHSGQLKGIDIWIDPHYRIVITDACNGIIPVLMVWAAMLAYPATLLHKTVWMLFGYMLFSFVNAMRIVMVVYLVERNEGQASFHWAHDILGNVLLVFVGLLVFVAFVKTGAEKPA